ncbi:MAG: cytochrome C [Acidobacteriota bacterium]
MTTNSLLKTSAAAAVFSALALSGLLLTSRLSQAANDKNPTQDEKQKILIGAQINPVLLTVSKKDADTVYLGSYIVNASCVECHTAPTFAPGGDPFKGQPKVINAAKFLAGGGVFGPFTSRNLTPDATGKPAGLTFSDFEQVMRHGTDFDHAHPQFGPLLQVMPWPAFQNMTDRDLQAIYAYLSAIPCVEGHPGDPADTSIRCH